MLKKQLFSPRLLFVSSACLAFFAAHLAHAQSLADPAAKSQTEASAQSDQISSDFATVTGPIVSILSSYDGAFGPAYKDHPDTAGAVGPNDVVDFVGAYVIVRQKITGRILRQQTQKQFWSALGVNPGTLNDPRIIYDPVSSRWYAVNAGPYIFLAVSRDSDPLHPWQAVVVSKIISGDLLPRIGVDANGLYVCAYGGVVSSLNTADCFVFPKADVLWTSARKLSVARMKTFTKLPYELFPATDFNPGKAPTDPEILLTRQGGQNVSSPIPMVLLLNKITWSGAAPIMSATQTVLTAMTYDTPGSALQPSEPPIRGAENHRFFNVFGVGTSVFAATGSKMNGRSGIEWFEVNSSGALLQQGAITDPSYDVLFPTVAVDKNRNLAIGYTKVSANQAASVYVSARLGTDPAGTLRAPALVAPGTAVYKCSANPVGWGTYSSTVLDPANPLVLWTFQEYANSSTPCRWATRWISFSL